MAAAKVFRPENRLATIVKSPATNTAPELVAKAEERINALSPNIRTYVAEKVDAILRHALQDDESLRINYPALAEAAVHVAEVAGAARLNDIGEIASGIGAMFEAYQSKDIWHSSAVRLHIGALQLIKAQNMPSQGNKVITDRLRVMRSSLGMTD